MPRSAARKLLIPCRLLGGPPNLRPETARLWDAPDAAHQIIKRVGRMAIHKRLEQAEQFRKTEIYTLRFYTLLDTYVED
jgi:hypothetical protein